MSPVRRIAAYPFLLLIDGLQIVCWALAATANVVAGEPDFVTFRTRGNRVDLDEGWDEDHWQ